MASWVTIIAVALNQEEEKLGLPYGPPIPNTPIGIPDKAFDVIAGRSQRIFETLKQNVSAELVGQEIEYKADD